MMNEVHLKKVEMLVEELSGLDTEENKDEKLNGIATDKSQQEDLTSE